MKTNQFQGKIRFIFGLLVLFAFIMIVRLYFLQVVYGSSYNEKADKQYVSVSDNTFDRGSIFFQDKNGSLISAAGLESGYIVAINPEEMATDTDKYYAEISKIIPLDEADFYSKVSKADDPYEEIAKEVSQQSVQEINALNLPGIIVENEKWRYYPGNDLASRVIGFVGYNATDTDPTGIYGLEKYYNTVLSRNNSNMYVNTFAELFSDINTNFLQDDKKEGDVVTTIEPQVQKYVEQVITAADAKWHAQATGAIVMDPTTGDIYSMAMSSNFNLNDYGDQSDVSIYANPLVSNAYEMGSIIKPLTMAAGIDSGSITATTTYDDTGFIKVDGSTIHNFDYTTHGAYGVIPMQIILNNSLNVGASFIATTMGKPTMLKYFQSFGIGSTTGIDLPDEASGNITNLLENVSNKEQIQYDTAAFGQGISMTPITTIRALSVIANGGKLITPHVVSQINYITGLSKTISSNQAVQVIKPSTAATVTQMLVNVVDQELITVDPTDDPTHYSIAAKTGTAQIARPANQGGGYYSDEYLHSFFGYFPAYNPRFIIFLYMYEPQNVNYAAQTLVAPFFDITNFLINYYQIPPDR